MRVDVCVFLIFFYPIIADKIWFQQRMRTDAAVSKYLTWQIRFQCDKKM